MADLTPFPDTGVGPDGGSSPGPPRWVNMSGIIGLVRVLLVGGLMLSGNCLGGFGKTRAARQCHSIRRGLRPHTARTAWTIEQEVQQP